MMSFRRIAGSLLVCLCLVAGGSAADALASGVASSTIGGEAGSSLLLGRDALAVPGVDQLSGGEQARYQRLAERVDPQAALARLRSRTAYERLGSRAAVQLARNALPAVVASAPGGLGHPPAGVNVVRYVSPTAAQVNLPRKRHGLVESLTPIATPRHGGGFAAVKLGLRGTASGFLTTGGDTRVSIARSLTRGAALQNGVSLVAVDAAGHPLRGAGMQIGSSVFYPGSEIDTDTAFKATSTGFETYDVLRSARSPEQLSFKLGVPAGAHVEAARGESGAVRVVRDGRTIAVVPSPAATDASGETVPVKATLSGRILRLTVAHRGGDFAYPIAVDPTVIDSELTGFQTNWRIEKGGPEEGKSFWGYDEYSAGWVIYTDSTHQMHQWGGLLYPTQGESHIYEVSMESSAADSGANVENHIVVGGKKGSEEPTWEARTGMSTSYGRTGASACVKGGCGGGVGTAGNVAGYWVNANGTGSGGEARVYTASVYMEQANGPTASFDTTDATLGGGVPNVIYGSGSWWGPKRGEVKAIGKDPGVGVKEVVYEDGTHKWTVKPVGGCVVECPELEEQLNGFNTTNGVYHEGLPDGESTLTIKAVNGMGMASGAVSTKVKVDQTAPTELTISGLPSGNSITDANHSVKIVGKAKDGAGATLSSGLASLKLLIDGKEVGLPSGSCSPGPCSATGEWTIGGEEFGAGSKTLAIVATDGAENAATTETTFTVHHASTMALGPGEINPVTGEFDLEANDVSVETANSPLQITRASNSREPEAGSEGPLGAPWTLTLGAAQSIVQLSTGNAMLVDVGDHKTVFTSIGSGRYKSPAGDTGLELTKTGEEFKLTKKGTTVAFSHVSGDVEGLYRPVLSTGTNGTSSTFYAYQVAGGITEPAEVLAPVPAGVSCSPTLKQGCRALTFNYASTTTATGYTSSQWGDFTGRLTRVYLNAYDTVSKEMKTTAVAQYSYDPSGRLRAEWDPRISPSLKTVYGYDSERRLTSAGPAGKEPWVLSYGTSANDTSSGRLVSAYRPPATTALGSGQEPKVSGSLEVSGSPAVGNRLTALSGTWSESPLTYAYQWNDCSGAGTSCAPIGGATNANYTPKSTDVGHTLRVEITAANAEGASGEMTQPTALVGTVWDGVPQQSSTFGTAGTGNGQLKTPGGIALDPSGNVWVADTSNNRIEEFTSGGTFVRTAGTSGSGLLSLPEGIAADASGNAWVADTGKSRIVEFNASGEYQRSFGSSGSGNGLLKSPKGVAIDKSGNVWVADTGNNRVQEFTAEGTFVRAFSGEGTLLKSPGGVALDSKGNVWVADTGNNRIAEFTAGGFFVAAFGTEGSEYGRFSKPASVEVDPNNDQIWVTDTNNSRVQAFTQSGEFITSFGLSGTGTGQFKAPSGLAFNLAGALYVLDSGNNRVVNWNDGAPKWTLTAGSAGTGNGQLKAPWGIARDSKTGNIWIADTSNNRIEEFTSEGAFVRVAGTSGSGLLALPEDVAVDGSGNVWVADTGNNRAVEFNSTGEYVRAFGAVGAENGQLKSPRGVALDKSGNVWVADSGNNRIQEFTSTGTFVRAVGTTGVGNGQLKNPASMAFDATGNVWVADKGNNRIEEFTSEGTFVRVFGSTGAGFGQFTNPQRLAIDSRNHIWVADTGNQRVQVFDAEGGFIAQLGSTGTASGQFKGPDGLAFTSTGYVWVLDRDNNRAQKWNTGYLLTEYSEGGAVSPPAATTIEYGVPVSGSGAPYQLSSTEVAKWAQADVPAEATAVFPPDEPMTSPASDYRRATVFYLDGSDRVVNTASAAGGITTAEYNSYGDVVRSLSADNRQAALKEGAKSAEVSQTLDAQSTYGSEGAELLESLGPLHTVKLANGTQVQARHHTVYSYDEAAPPGGPYRLVTKVVDGAQISGEPEADVRTRKTGYSGQNNLGWILRAPTSHTVDPSGLKLTSTTIYDPVSGNVTETRTPGAGAPNEEVTPYLYNSGFGSAGSGNGQMNGSYGMTRDASGNLWVADSSNNRIEEFSSGGTFIQTFGTVGVGNGQLKYPTAVAIDGLGRVWVADSNNNRIERFSATGTYQFQFKSSAEEGGELKLPIGVAIAKQGSNEMVVVGDRSNSRVVEYYMTGAYDGTVAAFGHENGQVSKPGDVKVDSSNNIWVADTFNNRVEEFSGEGWAFIRSFETGSAEGLLKSPNGIAFDSEGNVLVADAGNSRVVEFNSAGAYLGKFGVAGSGEQNMSVPENVAVDSSNNAFVLDTGHSRIQKWTPHLNVHEGSGTGGTYGKQTIYYTTAANSEVTACGGHAEWAGLPCEIRPAAQPETAGVPNLPVTTFTYDMGDEPLTSTEAVGTTTRTTTNTYDGADRLLSTSVTSTVGTALPTTKFEYNAETGALIKQSAVISGVTKTVETSYDKRGELVSYKDADGNTATSTYDVDGRPETANDGKGTQTYTYDTTTGLLTNLVDSAAGTFTGTYDVEGNLLTAGYPNGMNVNHTINAAGEETGVEYVKTTNCSSNCTWYSETEVPSVRGQTLSQSSTFSSQTYTYDEAGRLTKTQDTPTGEGCTTRVYAVDVETNISSLTTRSPGTEGKCATEGGTAVNHSYDTANRLTDTGIAYDTFGDITTLPAGDAGGSALTSSYYVDDTLAGQTQNGQTIGYNLDPTGRPRQTVSTGTINSTVTSHYAGDGKTVAWSEDTGGKWTRMIQGLEGLVAVQSNGESPVLQIEDLHGDFVATASLSQTAGSLLSKNDTTEYGVPRTSAPPKYSWQGAYTLATELPSGVVAMGARSYVPQIGRFLQPDPVEGGSANAYAYTFGDPVGSHDPSGEFAVEMPEWVHEFLDEQAEIATEEAIERAAEEQAAREEAEEKAAEAAAEAAEAAAEAAAGGGSRHGHHGGHHHAGGGMHARPLLYSGGRGHLCKAKCKEKRKEKREVKRHKRVKKEAEEEEEQKEKEQERKEELERIAAAVGQGEQEAAGEIISGAGR